MAKILVVDDENLILYSLTKTLNQAGAEVTAVSNGKDALHEIGQRTYDACFLDVQLPDANGLDLMNIIKERSPRTIIIIMTAANLDETQLRSLEKHGCRFLPKPFEFDDIVALTREFFGTEGMAAGEA